jgi:hypothetical protein
VHAYIHSSLCCRRLSVARVCVRRVLHGGHQDSGLRTEMHTARSFLQIDRWMEKSAFGCDTCGYGRCETPYGSASQVDDGSQGHEWRWLLAGWHVTVPFVPDPFEPSGRQELLPKISSCSKTCSCLCTCLCTCLYDRLSRGVGKTVHVTVLVCVLVCTIVVTDHFRQQRRLRRRHSRKTCSSR